MSARYVLTGGSDTFADVLTAALRAPVERGAPPAGSPDLAAWIHVLPDAAAAPGDAGQTGSLLEAAELAGQRLPEGQGATFVAVVPVWGVLGAPGNAAVEIAAGAARSLGAVHVDDWSQRGLRFNIVAYGALDAPGLAGRRDAGLLTDRTPMHRLAEVRELADAIDFLASSSAGYVTGSTLPVDGGWTAYSWFHPARDL